MKKLLFLLLLIPFLGTSQGTFTAPVGYNTGTPTAAPSGVGTRWRFDLLTGKKYTWLPGSMAWDEDAAGIDQVSGCASPAYTPGYNQSNFAVNSCSTPELYQYYSSAWHCLNCGGGTNISAGSGITITGAAPDITISADDNSPTNELQTLSIDGNDLTLSDGGGTVTIPAGADGNGIYGGDGVLPSNVSVDGGGHNLSFLNILALSFGGDQLLFEAQDQSFLANNNILIKPTNDLSFEVEGTTTISTDNGLGFQYVDEYPDILTNDRSIPDVGLTKTLIASEGWSWPLLAPDGSAAAPSYSFSNSAETGIFYNNALLVASAPQGAVNARNIEIKSGSGTSGNGGAVLINAGNSSGRGGGQVSVTAGNSSGRNGGQINFRAGDTDTQTGGAVTLQSGNGATGGNYNMIAGSGTSGNGGTFYFIGGNSASALGGNIEFVAGNGVDQSKNGDIIFAGNQAVLPLLTISQRDNISVKKIGGTIYCSDCTATDSSTGVQQVYNGSTWKNAW